MPRVRIRKAPKPGKFIPQNDVLGEMVKRKGGKIRAKLDNDQGYPFQRDQGYMYDQDMGGVIVPMHVPEMDTNMYKKGGNWLKGAVNPAHKGYCTPMSKSTCTGHRRAFALMMKKKHGFHKKDEGGAIYDQNLIGNITNPEYYPNSSHNQYKQGGKYIGAGPNTDLNPTTNHTIADYNPYVYFKNKNWYITSNPEDEKITESVKPVDESVANIEAEKGEYIAKPGLTGLYKITGKTHAEGGTPLYAEGGSFIFSNDPKLSFNKGEREAFGFKGGQSFSKSKNTPAKVLGREVDPKEYNGYIATLESPDTDRIAKTTAGLMLEKLQQKIGQVAYLQEAKKGTKAPDFAQGTAPEVKPEFQNIDEKMSEYNYGGFYDGGGEWPPIGPTDKYPGGRTPLGRITPTGVPNAFNYKGGVPQLIKDWQGAGIDLTNMDVRQAQDSMYNWALKNNPDMLRNLWKQYGNTAAGQRQHLNYDYNNLNDSELQAARHSYSDGLLGARIFSPDQGWPRIPTISNPPGNDPGPPNPSPNQPSNPVQPEQPNNPGTSNRPNPTLPYQIKGKLTDAQIANLGYLGLQSFNINRYYPTRQQVSLPQVRLDQVSSQPYLNQINTQAHEAYELAALRPRDSSLIGSNIRGSALDQSSQAIGNVANQNVQIGNQQNLTNLQQMTQQVMTNAQLNNQYYNQVQATNQNFDNERRFANNQFMSNLNNYQSQADKLAWSLASVNKYGLRQVTDPKTGQTYNLPTPLYEINKNGIQYNADVANLNMASGANRINTPQEISQIYRQFKDSGMPDVEAQRIVSAIIRSRTTKGAESQGPFFTQNPYGPNN